MDSENLDSICQSHLREFCDKFSERSVGSKGNRHATQYFVSEMASFGWNTELHEFCALDWADGGAELTAGDQRFEVFVSPYSTGCDADAELIQIPNILELGRKEFTGKIILLHGEIAKEQLMPKNFDFYNPEEHQRIISLIERGKPKAVICATGRNASLAGGVYPFPLIEDGDFDIPSVYMTDEEGKRLLPYAGKMVRLKSTSRRIPAKGFNVIARKGRDTGQRIVITAHIDAKKGTPGAIDNATGIVVLLLLARLLAGYDREKVLEMVALNGEDYYAVPGQMMYVSQNQGRFHEILLNINIDGAGYKEGKTALSFYQLPKNIKRIAEDLPVRFAGLTLGPQWPQGDHSIFVQNGSPAIAVSSEWFVENIDSQEITHTPKDNIQIVDCEKLVEIGRAIQYLIERLNAQ